MRGRATRSAIAASSAACWRCWALPAATSSPHRAGRSPRRPISKIVEQVQIDQNGAEVKPEAGTTPADPAGDGKATCPPVSIAMAGALNGPDAALGINIKNGVQLAIDKHNAANPGCQVQLKPFDTEGDPQKATAIAPQIVDDAFTIGLVGPAFSGETKATGAVFDQAGLVAATASATNVDALRAGLEDVLPRPGQRRRAGPVGRQLPEEHPRRQEGLRRRRQHRLRHRPGHRRSAKPSARWPIRRCNISVKKGDKDFSAAVTQVKGQSPDSVFYSGYYAEAAPFVQQLRDGGFTGKFVSADGTKDPEFVKQAGESSKDAILSCPCGPATGAFADEYTKKFGQAPGTYSTEGYDLGTILLKGIDAGKITRPDLLDCVKNYDGQGVARKYQWTDTGELTTTLIWIYKVQ